VLITYILPRHSWVGLQSHTTSFSEVSLTEYLPPQ
jgi:hypothetical protein